MPKHLRYIITFATLLFGLSVQLNAQTHFTPVDPTGVPYHVIINSNTITGVYSASQVEIGIFDGTECVGSGVVTINSNQTMDIVAWEGDSNYNLAGFIAGNPITIQLAIEEYGTTNIVTGTADYSVGDGTFGYGSYSVASVTGAIEEVPDIEVNPTLLSFGALDLGETVVQSFMVKNQGVVMLQVNSISVPNGYSISTGTFNVNPDDSLEVWVTFSPNSPIDYSGSLWINSNDPFQLQTEVKLTGQGLADLIPKMIITPSSLIFGAVSVGNSEAQNFTIRNQGSVVLNIFSVSTNHTEISAQYSSFSLQPGEEQLIEVEYTPSVGSMSGSVLILHNDPGQSSPYAVPVSGYGYENQFSPVPETGLPYIMLINHVNLDDHSIPYGSQIGVFDENLCVGAAVYLDSYPLQVTAWEADPSNDLSGFTAGDSISIRVHTTAFDSVTVIDANIDLSVGDGLFGTGSYSVVSLNLESNLAPRLSVFSTQLEFPITTTGETSSRQLMIYNTGATDLTITSCHMDNNAFVTNYDAGLIESGDSISIEIIFSPSQGAWHQGNLYIYSNDPDNQTQIVALSGVGVVSGQPAIQIPITSISMGDIALADTGWVDIHVFNTGNDTLKITSIISNNNQIFKCEIQTLDIPANASGAVTIHFNPDQTGWHNSTITIYSNAANQNEADLSFTGYGYDGYFEPVTPTGEQYQFVVSNITDLTGYGFDEGDEIGVFDDMQCVGVGIFHESDSLNISVWQALPDKGLPGYTDGHLVQFKYYLTDSELVEHVLDIVPEFISGDGAFGTGVFSEVSLTIIDRSTPFEPYAGPVFYVSVDDGQDYINNGSYNQPFRTIQHGINVVEDNDTILVRPGTYVENINFNGKNIVLSSLFLTSGDTSHISQTIIDGNQNGSVVTFENGEDNTALISGLTIENGLGSGSGHAGGIFCDNSSPHLEYLIVQNNSGYQGGGISCYNNSSPLIFSLIVRNNYASHIGGGLYTQYNCNPQILNSLFYGNYSEELNAGGMIFRDSSNPVISNTTIVNNGGGVYSSEYSHPLVKNCILWGNINQIKIELSEFTISHSNVQAGEQGIIHWNNSSYNWGGNNIDMDPIFVDSANSNYHLNPISPCIDNGDPISGYSSEPEPNGDRINMGAYGNTPEATIAAITLMRPDNAATEDSLYTANLMLPPDSSVIFYYSLISAPEWVNFNESLAEIYGTPDNSHVGSNEITVEANDNYGRVHTPTFTVEVANSAAFITSEADTIATEDQLYYYNLESNDEGLGPARYHSLVIPSWISLDSLSGELSGVPGDSAVGDTSVSIQFQDGYGGNDIQSFTLRVVNMNDAITIISMPDTITFEDYEYIYEVETLDDDLNDAARFSLNIAPNGMEIDSLTGRISWLPDYWNVGDTTVSLSVMDDSGSTDIQSYTLHVLSTNDPPLLDNFEAITFDEDDVQSIHLNYFLSKVSDQDDPNSTLEWRFINTNNIQASISDDSIHVDTKQDWFGIDTISVIVSDTALSDTSEWIITVLSIQDYPRITSIADTVATEGRQYFYEVAAYDPDPGDPISFELNTAPGGMVINAHTGVIGWLPDDLNIGDTLVTLTVTDATNRSTTQSFTLHIISTNDAIQIVSVADSIAWEDEEYTYAVETLDDDLDDKARYYLNIAPFGMSIDSVNGRISWFPTNDDVGDTVVSFAVIDDSGATDSQTYNLAILNTNDIPVITSIADTLANEDELYAYTVLATDDDLGDNLSFSLEVHPWGMSIDENTGIISWLPDNDDVGDTLVMVIVTDDSSAFVTQNFYLTVENVNDPPIVIFSIGDFSVNEDAPDTSFALYEIFDDVDRSTVDDTLIFTLTNNNPGIVSSSIINDTLLLDYLDNQNGSINLSITATDISLSAITESFTNIVTAVNDTPSTFSLITEDAVVFYDSVITFVWQSSKDPDIATNADKVFYTFRYSEVEDFSAYYDIEDINDTTLVLNLPFIQDHTYFWKVRVEDYYRVKVWSGDVHSFSLNYEDNPPTIPVILTPYTNAVFDTSSRITWNMSLDEDLEDTVSYEVEITNDRSFENNLVTYAGGETAVNVTDLPYQLLLENGLHFVRVRAVDSDMLYSAWSDTVEFYWDNLNQAPNRVITLFSPVDTVLITLTPNFIWSQASDIDPGDVTNSLHYRGSVWSAVDTFAFNTEPGDTSTTLLADLAENEFYQWAVKSVDDGGLSSGYSDTAGFWVNVNHDPIITITPLVGWQTGIIPVHMDYDDPENDILTIDLYFSLDGSYFIGATTAEPAATNSSFKTELYTTNNTHSSVIHSNKQQRDNFNIEFSAIKHSDDSKDKAAETKIQLLSSDTTINWYSTSDLPAEYAGEVWLIATVYDADSDVFSDTVSLQVDNDLPDLTLEAIVGEVSGILAITGHLNNDAANDVSITGEYKIHDTDIWEKMSFNYVVSAGTELVEIAWNTINDLGVGSDVIVDIRMQASDGQGIGSYAYLNLLHVDNNGTPMISTLELVPSEPRGDILIKVYITDAENDSLTYQCEYSLNNGINYYPTNSFIVSGDYVSNGFQSITWQSFEDVLNTVSNQTRFRVTPSDNDVGQMSAVPKFSVFNLGGPQFKMIMNVDYPNLLWQDTIKVKFNHGMDGATALDGIGLSSDAQDMSFDYLMTGNDSVINIIPHGVFYPDAPVEITLTADLQDSEGYAFDGNRNYVPDGLADDKIITMQTPELVDFDFNGVLNELDLLKFVLNWNLTNPDLRMEIGPSYGALPYTTFEPDGLFDYEDLMVFIATWKWKKNQGSLARSIEWSSGQLPELVADELKVNVNSDHELELNIDMKIPQDLDITVLRYNIEGLDSIPEVRSRYLNSRFEETILLQGEGETFLAGFTPTTTTDNQDGILSISTCIDERADIGIQITAWDSEGEEVFTGRRQIKVDPLDYIPREFAMNQNYPNPFNGSTIISYAIPDEAKVSMILYDIRGRQVRTLIDENQAPGFYQMHWNGLSDEHLALGAGIYLCRLQAGSHSQIIKMVLLK